MFLNYNWENFKYVYSGTHVQEEVSYYYSLCYLTFMGPPKYFEF